MIGFMFCLFFLIGCLGLTFWLYDQEIQWDIQAQEMKELIKNLSDYHIDKVYIG